MTAKEKLAAAKAGKRVTTSDSKTRTTTQSGWSLTTGVQKKTQSPKARKPSIAPTAGKTIKYHGGKSTVIDLGHNPTKSAISTATTTLRAAKKTTKPKANKNTAAAVPTVKVPQEGAPTTTPDTKSNTAGKIVAAGVAAVAGAAGAYAALRKPKTVKATGKITPPKALPAPPKGLSGPEKKLPAPPKGLPGREKPVRLPERPMDSLSIAAMPKPTKRQVLAEARERSAPKAAKVKPPSTAPKTPTKVKAPSTWTERGVRGKTIDLTAKPKAPKAPATQAVQQSIKPTGVGYYTVEGLDVIDRRKASERREKQRGRDRRGSPKPPKVGEVPDILGGLSKQQRQGKLPVVVKGVAPPKPGELITAEAHGPEAPKVTAPKVARVTAGGTEAKNVYKQAREAMRSGDPERMKAAVGKLPKGTKKTEKFTKNLEAGIQAAGNRPPPETRAPKADVPALEAPKAEAPKVGRLEGVSAPKAEAPKTKSTKNLKRDLARAQATNEKLKAAPDAPAKVEAPVEPSRGITPADTTKAAGDLRGVAVESVKLTTEQVAAGRKKASERGFRRQQRQARRATRDAAIAEKGIATIPTDPAAVTSEELEVKQRRLQNDLLDATMAEGRGRVPTAPKAVGSETDKRTAVGRVGKAAVEDKVRVIPEGPRDLETEHGGGRQRGTIAGLIDQDTEIRDARNEEIRKAAGKARTMAASRDASPEQMKGLERAVDAEYDRSLELYFDDVADEAPRNQAGPKKPDARPRILDSMIDAETELAEARGAASPPAPGDRTTVAQKIKVVKERMKAGGESIYKGEDTLRMLENIRDFGRATPAPLKSTRALPPAAALPAEHFGKDRPSIKAASREGKRAGEAAAKAKRLSGEAGPVKVPDMTKPGVVPAGPTTPPAEPARERGVVKGAQSKTPAQLWSGRMAEWGRSAYKASIRNLTSPFLDTAGGKAKDTAKAEARVRKASGVAKGLGVATVGFAALGAGEAYAKEHDPKKRAGAAVTQFKSDVPEVAKGVAKFTGMDLMATVAVPAAIGAATKSVAARGAAVVAGKLGIAGLIGYHAIPFAIDQSKKLASAIGEAQFDKGEAARKKKASEAKYGTVEAATKTRHAKEAYKRRQALEAKKGKK